MNVSQRGADLLMSQQLLQLGEGHPRLKTVSRKRVAKTVYTNAFGDTRLK